MCVWGGAGGTVGTSGSNNTTPVLDPGQSGVIGRSPPVLSCDGGHLAFAKIEAQKRHVKFGICRCERIESVLENWNTTAPESQDKKTMSPATTEPTDFSTDTDAPRRHNI